jgi:hypothetical protein
VPIEVEPGDTGTIARLSIERATKEPGYRPRYGWQAGARASINEYRRRQGLPPLPGSRGQAESER